jgi:hypothetical protein
MGLNLGKLACLAVIVIMVSVVALAGAAHVGIVNASTEVTGIITSDTTWTKAGSPYDLKGPVAVYSGVTLTVEAGATVNLNQYYIQVNGTLTARGTDNDKIHFNGGSITFTSVSTGWNEQANSGSILENAVLTDSISISGVSVKVTKSSFSGISIDGGSSTVSYNTIDSVYIANGSPLISNNKISGDFTMRGGSPTVTANTIQGRPWVRGGSPVISDNKIYDGIHADASGGPVTISNNEISSKTNYRLIYVAGVHADISGNKIIGNNNNPAGISVGGVLSSATITQNQIFGCQTGINVDQCDVQISRNVILNNNIGVNIVFRAPIAGATGPWGTNPTAEITENTITKNSLGIQYAPYVRTSTIANNNIYANSQYNFKLQYPNDIAIPDNWWGTSDTQAINQTIFDFKNDFNLGTVTFTPFLAAPNPEAPAETYVPPPTTSIPTPTPYTPPSQTPTSSPANSPTPSQPTLTPEQITTIVGAAIVAIVIGAAVGLLIYLVKRK